MHFLYVATGSVFLKIGITSKPKARGRAIGAEFRKRGDVMTRFVVMPGMPAGFGVESSLCHSFAALADRVDGREWFLGLDPLAVIDVVRASVMKTRRFQMGSRSFMAFIEREVAAATPRKAKPTPEAA